jgi:hypothetical protein
MKIKIHCSTVHMTSLILAVLKTSVFGLKNTKYFLKKFLPRLKSSYIILTMTKLKHISFQPTYRSISVTPNCDLSWANESKGFCVDEGWDL